MDGSLYSVLIGDFGPIITLIIVVAFSITAILRFGVQFDLNKYLESRKKKHEALAQVECPHLRFESTDEGVVAESLFYTPFGTTNWICRQCGIVIPISPDEANLKKTAEYYLQHQNEYNQKIKRFERHAKKAM